DCAHAPPRPCPCKAHRRSQGFPWPARLLAAACWAICAFERQGHLVGTVTGLSIPAQPHDELAPLHSVTSSARASSVSGKATPSAFAALRLMTSSTFVTLIPVLCHGGSYSFLSFAELAYLI